MKKVDLTNLKVGDFVKCSLHGAGHVTQGEDSEVFHIDPKAKIFWIGEWDETYRNDSIYAYSLETGKSINNFMPGFYNQVTAIA
jgi:hypothetical protein